MDFLACIPCRVEGFQMETIEGEIILLHPARNLIIHCNQSGALIWNLCDGNRTVAEIIELLGAAYPEARDEIAVNVPVTIQELLSHGALAAA